MRPLVLKQYPKNHIDHFKKFCEKKKDLKKQILDTIKISLNDNVKSRLINLNKQNEFVENKNKKIRSQWDTYDYFCKINT